MSRGNALKSRFQRQNLRTQFRKSDRRLTEQALPPEPPSILPPLDDNRKTPKHVPLRARCQRTKGGETS